MKKIFYLFIALSIYACGNKTIELPTKSNQDDFGKQVIKSIKSNDSTDYKKLFIDKPGFKEIIKTSSLSKEAKAEENKKIDYKLKQVIKSIQPSFIKLKKSLANAGIDSKKIKFSKLEANSFQKNGMTTAQITIYFTFEDVEYKLYSSKTLLTKSGWKISTPFYFQG